MKTRFTSLLIIGMLLVLVACNVPSTSQSVATQGNPTSAPIQSTSVPTSQISPTTQSNPTSSSACDNPYFPSTPGATWTYANTSSLVPPSTTVRTLTGITATGLVTHDVTSGDIQVDTKWSCKDGALAMLEEDSVSTVTAGNLKWEIGSVKASGYLLPAALKAGQTWSESLEIASNGYIDGPIKRFSRMRPRSPAPPTVTKVSRWLPGPLMPSRSPASTPSPARLTSMARLPLPSR